MPFINTGDLSKLIYEYDRGDRVVKADPAVIWRKLNQACHERQETLEGLLKKWNDTLVKPDDSPEVQASKIGQWFATELMIDAVGRETFRIPELDEDGVGGTTALVIQVLTDFLTEREKKSSNIETSLSSSPCTAGAIPDSSREFSVSTD